ncbi:hypothetical protein SAMN05443572_10611 [Myxococcus fulvus]|uniref:Tetratricopeptide repeat protein n=1 Tax=Myxococcus fulvus TaxID=33 RepID=A0A511TH39_MYXFU|nr:hypothetical protein [Myxococcus fulvus]GEN13477.1 hypothetical protein MFU01_85140 [Myxococcus fulvus]SEU19423.1 hypothetical protein SAMN05443572_10611 [Myxococcus fulvus]
MSTFRFEGVEARCALVALCLLGLSCVKRPVDYAREHAQTLAPAKMESTSKASVGAVRKLRVRVYADSDYREQVVRWRSSIVSQLQRASAVVRGPLGVEFELESTREWAHRGVEGELGNSLSALELADPGEGVDLVVGLVSTLKFYTASHHELGMARLFGRHFVIREMGNPDEVRAIMEALVHLPQDEQQTLYQQRKQHKETSVFLHEWAHTLGAFHVHDSHWMMSPNYGSNQGAFSPQTLSLLATSLRHASKAQHDEAAALAWATELWELLTSTSWPAWEGPQKEAIVDWLAKVRAGAAPLTQQPPKASTLTADDRRRLDTILTLDREGRVEVAAQQMEPLARFYPEDAHIQSLACYLGTRAAPKLPATREKCTSVAQKFSKDASPLLQLAVLDLQDGQHLEAQGHLVRARQRMEAAPGATPDVWGDLAALFKQTSSLTWTEQALAKTGDEQRTRAVRTWTVQTRRWMALPVEPSASGVAVEREGELIRAAKDVEASLDKGPATKAQTRLAWLKREFPRAAVQHVLDCEIHLRSGRLGPAKTACRKAVAANDDAVQAHFILGWMASMSGARTEARTHLERVVTLEPLHTEAWKLLAEQYRAAGMQEALKTLQGRYREQFAQELR